MRNILWRQSVFQEILRNLKNLRAMFLSFLPLCFLPSFFSSPTKISTRNIFLFSL